MKVGKSGEIFGFERFLVCVFCGFFKKNILLLSPPLLVNFCSNMKEENGFVPGLTCIKHVAISANQSDEHLMTRLFALKT